MTNSWKEWEGRTVDGKFVLGNYQGGSDGDAVFRTRLTDSSVPGGSDAAIKLRLLAGSEADAQLRSWNAAGVLSHPNLIRIFAAGHCAVEGGEVAYVVEEFAEENLAQIIPERALTSDEVRGMLGPVLDGLEYIHAKGMVHGRIKPANILAIGDQVKLSTDDLRTSGEIPAAPSVYDAPEVLMGVSPASDLWSLGITLVEVLTQRVPARDTARLSPPHVENRVPQPFREIANRCLQAEPAKRCTIEEVRDRLKGKRIPSQVSPIEVITSDRESVTKWPYVLLLAAVVAVAIFLFVRTRPASDSSADQTAKVETSPSPETPRPSSAAPAAAPVEPPKEETKNDVSQKTEVGADQKAPPKRDSKDGVVERVMPQVSPSARRTIEGHIKVRVKVKVDPSGNVSQASFRDAGPSKYFSRVAMEAAKGWKFTPAADQTNRDWTLLFVFSRAHTEASAAQSR